MISCWRWHVTALLNNVIVLCSVIPSGARPCQTVSPSLSCNWKTSGFSPQPFQLTGTRVSAFLTLHFLPIHLLPLLVTVLRNLPLLWMVHPHYWHHLFPLFPSRLWKHNAWRLVLSHVQPAWSVSPLQLILILIELVWMLSPVWCHCPCLCLRHQCQVLISFQLLIYLLKNVHLLLSSSWYTIQLMLMLLIRGAELVVHCSDELLAICSFTTAEPHFTCTSGSIEPSALGKLWGQNPLACCCSDIISLLGPQANSMKRNVTWFYVHWLITTLNGYIVK